MDDGRQGDTAILTTYVDEDTKTQLVALADRNERSVAAELRLAIRRHLEQNREVAA